MTASLKLGAMFELAGRYEAAFAAYRARGVDRELDPQDKEWPDHEAWRAEHYMQVGADALRLIVASLIANLREPPQRILDFPSGSGRVTRHLRSFFPTADICACDLHESHIAFCAQHFGAWPKQSL